MSQLTLSGLFFYPVKSLRCISLERAPVDSRGIHYDRHWMVVDGDGKFLTQRQHPRMALVRTALTPGGLRLSAPGMPDLDVAFEPEGVSEAAVQVWGDQCLARSAGEAPASWLSHYLGMDCRLFFMPEQTERPVDPTYAAPEDRVGFADGFPFLLISQASLDDLNRRLDEALPMIRFRPNLVVSGCEPYAEDGWRRIRIGKVIFRVAKPCSRCVIPTINPETGEKGVEPLRTLNRYRREGNKVYFGQNLLHDGAGELKLGSVVEVLE
ncbi:MOSC domain-containing protein [Sedimenticola selenatireducens]|uniref:MOSC domain-containing protein n=1 Tax=Sedimenticola selenatireducens TaxID=191960 RepID=A0A2N6CY40_9GAMM|nr:MOSC domain-containing protein [Sedimenticola selenatireducens]PLX62226.1 MAG: MOSC domain-containing protein [Sedimenticola selenatireducens]